MTVRQVYYRMVAAGVIHKTHDEYRAVQQQLLWLRRHKVLPYAWITDNTRYRLRPQFLFASITDALQNTIDHYRHDLWANTSSYVEIWAESDAVAGVLNLEADTWGVPVLVFRGYNSASFLRIMAQEIEGSGRPAFVYYFGDWDPSGEDIPRDALKQVREHIPDVDITFERITVIPEQITAWNLPTAPPKRTDSRTKKFKGGTVEIEAIPPGTLREMVRDCITRHIDQHQLQMARKIENEERETMVRAMNAGMKYLGLV